MTFDDFIAKQTGKPVDFDGVYPNQCMDLMHQYVYDVLGLTDRRLLAHPSAYQVFTDFNETDYFEKIANTPTGVPQKGDIVLFNKTSSNPYGHVCVFVSGDENAFKSFDANFPTGSLPHIQDHKYTNCLGWLRPKKDIESDTIAVKKSDFEQLVGKSSEYDKFVAGGYTHLEDVQKVVSEKETTIQNLTKDINACEIQVGKMLDDAKKINEEDKNTSTELLDAQHALQPLKDELEATRRELGIFPESSITDAIKALKSSKVKQISKPVTFLEKLQFLFT